MFHQPANHLKFIFSHNRPEIQNNDSEIQSNLLKVALPQEESTGQIKETSSLKTRVMVHHMEGAMQYYSKCFINHSIALNTRYLTTTLLSITSNEV